MSTIYDVAKESGVSKSTVSRVVSQDGYVSEKTRKRVMDAMAKLDYTPNLVARGMRTKRSATIGFFVPDYANPFYTELFKGVEAVARENGYVSLVCHTGEEKATELHYIKELLKRKVDGVIFCTYNRSREAVKYLQELSTKLPIVIMDPVLKDLGLTSVFSDTKAGIELGLEHVISLGCKRIAYIGGPDSREVTQDRCDGYIDGLKSYGLPYNPAFLYRGDFTIESGQNAVKYFLGLDESPDAIISATDLMALGALKELRLQGLRIPEDMKVIGFDNISLCQLVEPTLTTVAQPISELGKVAAQLLLEKILDPDVPSKQVVMQCSLVKRESA